MTQHILTKHKLGKLSPQEFETVMNRIMLSEREKCIMRLIYYEHKPFGFIGDIVGYAESTIRLKHRQIIEKISGVL